MLRICSNNSCNNTWGCDGICGEEVIIKNNTFCWCKSCLHNNMSNSRIRASQWRTGNRKNLNSYIDILIHCYNETLEKIIADEL